MPGFLWGVDYLEGACKDCKERLLEQNVSGGNERSAMVLGRNLRSLPGDPLPLQAPSLSSSTASPSMRPLGSVFPSLPF